MKNIAKTIPAGLLAASVMLGAFAPPAFGLGPTGPRYKNNLGMYMVQCQVHKNETGNPVVGFVIGNHRNDPEQAEKEANNFTSKFGDEHAKRHCKTIKKYRQNGAYDTNWNPR